MRQRNHPRLLRYGVLAVMKYLALQRKWKPLAEKLMDQHGLIGWYFKFNTNKRRLGVCKYRERMIEASIYAFGIGEDEVRNIILHEIAHAKVGGLHGHNDVWRAAALAIGCTGERCGGAMIDAPAKYIGTCPKCSQEIRRFKKTARMTRVACTRCCNTYSFGRYDERFKIIWRNA